jgi:alpha/beta superfamily hydrolase
MKVIFSHGLESGPWGSKIKYLASIAIEMGWDVDSIDYSGIRNPDDRVTKLVEYLNQEKQPFLLCGSSMGGYVSVVASRYKKPLALFLMAPALYLPGYREQIFAPNGRVTIIHGVSDDVVPFENSQRFVREHLETELHLIESDHRLNDSLEVVGKVFKHVLENLSQADKN